MKSMIEASAGIKDMLSGIMREKMRRVKGDYAPARERARADGLLESQVVCWKNDILLLSSKTKFPVKRLEVDNRVFVSQMHLWEHPRTPEHEELETLLRQGVHNLRDVSIIGSVFVFYNNEGKDACLTGNIYCRNWKDWSKITSDDLIVIYVQPDYPVGDVDGLGEQFQDYLKMNAFLNSPYAFSEPRKIRPKGKRSLKRPKNTEVKVVVMRKTPKMPSGTWTPEQKLASGFYPEMNETDEEKLKRRLSVRFKVVGHWRNQWYPSEGVHKRIWISEHDKGPNDAPYLAHIRVVKAIR